MICLCHPANHETEPWVSLIWPCLLSGGFSRFQTVTEKSAPKVELFFCRYHVTPKDLPNKIPQFVSYALQFFPVKCIWQIFVPLYFHYFQITQTTSI